MTLAWQLLTMQLPAALAWQSPTSHDRTRGSLGVADANLFCVEYVDMTVILLMGSANGTPVPLAGSLCGQTA